MIYKQKKGFLIRDFVIVGVLFGTIISLYIIQVTSISSNYDNTDIIDSDFANHYNSLNSNLNELNIATKAVKGTGGLNLIGVFEIAFNSVYTVISTVWAGLNIYTGMAGSFISDFTFLDAPVVKIVLSSAIAILTAYILFVWLSSVSRGKL